MGYRNIVLSCLDDLKKYEAEARDAILKRPTPDVDEAWRAAIDAGSTVNTILGELYDSCSPPRGRGGPRQEVDEPEPCTHEGFWELDNPEQGELSVNVPGEGELRISTASWCPRCGSAGTYVNPSNTVGGGQIVWTAPSNGRASLVALLADLIRKPRPGEEDS